jgi:transcriptional regulator with XRE-family HTH domain
VSGKVEKTPCKGKTIQYSRRPFFAQSCAKKEARKNSRIEQKKHCMVRTMLVQTNELTKKINQLFRTKVTQNDMRFVRAAQAILGWKQTEFARRARLSVEEARLEKPEEVPENVKERILRTLLVGGAGNAALLRAARGLLGVTQRSAARAAEVAPGTYRKFENASFTVENGIEATGTLAKVLTYLASKGISFTFSGRDGGGVAQKKLLRNEYLEFDFNLEGGE